MMLKKYLKLIITVVVILVIFYVVPIVYLAVSPWRAIFLDSGQVYFGKMISLPFVSTVDLTNVYYINTSKETGQDILLAKIRDDIHGPNDKLTITKSHILYYETLRSDSQLVKAIQNKQKK